MVRIVDPLWWAEEQEKEKQNQVVDKNDGGGTGKMAYTIVIVTHGVQFNDDFDRTWLAQAYEFIYKIQQGLLPHKRTHTIFQSVNWNQFIAEKEKKLWGLCKDGFWKKLVKVACFGVADVLAYERPQRTLAEGDLYYDVQKAIKDKIDKCKMLYGQDSNVILIGHSLGSQAIFNYSWDNPPITGLVTMGSPILYYSTRFHGWGEPPKVGWWLNFRSKYDPVATPISSNPNPAFKFVEEVDTTSWLKPLPILAHGSYWLDSRVHKKIAEKLNAV